MACDHERKCGWTKKELFQNYISFQGKSLHLFPSSHLRKKWLENSNGYSPYFYTLLCNLVNDSLASWQPHKKTPDFSYCEFPFFLLLCCRVSLDGSADVVDEPCDFFFYDLYFHFISKFSSFLKPTKKYKSLSAEKMRRDTRQPQRIRRKLNACFMHVMQRCIKKFPPLAIQDTRQMERKGIVLFMHVA